MFRRRMLAAGSCVLLLLAVLPVSTAAAAAPSHRCTDNEVITHGSFGIFNATGVRCTVSHVDVAHGYEFDGYPGPVSQLTASASTFGSIWAIDSDLTLTSSTVTGPLSLWDTAVVTIDRSYFSGGLIGADSYLVANQMSVTNSTFIGTFQPTVNDLVLDGDYISGGLVIISGADDEGTEPPERYFATIERTHFGADTQIDGQQEAQLCDVHVTGTLDIEDDFRVYLGGYSDPTRSCGPNPAVRIDGNLRLGGVRGLLRNVSVAGTLSCGNATMVFQHVTVHGKRVTHC